MIKTKDFDTYTICFIDCEGLYTTILAYPYWQETADGGLVQNKICTVTCQVTIKFHVIYFYKAYFCLKQ